MKKRFGVACMASVLALGCLCSAGCGDNGGSDSSSAPKSSVAAVSYEKETDLYAAKADAMMADTACKDYYSRILSGTLNGADIGTKVKRNQFLENASIKDAFEYVSSMELVAVLDAMSADQKGNIFLTALPGSMTADDSKTEILRTKYSEAGSLKALYEKS